MLKNLFVFTPVVISSACALFFMEVLARKPNIDFSEAALGTQNTSRFAVRESIALSDGSLKVTAKIMKKNKQNHVKN